MSERGHSSEGDYPGFDLYGTVVAFAAIVFLVGVIMPYTSVGVARRTEGQRFGRDPSEE
jgi:hypothetical protein